MADHENRDHIRESQGVLSLLGLLRSPQVSVQAGAASALFNCALAPDNVTLIRQHGGLELLLSLAQATDHAALQAGCVGALMNCALGTLLRPKPTGLIRQLSCARVYTRAVVSGAHWGAVGWDGEEGEARRVIRDYNGVAALHRLLVEGGVAPGTVRPVALGALYNLSIDRTTRSTLQPANWARTKR